MRRKRMSSAAGTLPPRTCPFSGRGGPLSPPSVLALGDPGVRRRLLAPAARQDFFTVSARARPATILRRRSRAPILASGGPLDCAGPEPRCPDRRPGRAGLRQPHWPCLKLRGPPASARDPKRRIDHRHANYRKASAAARADAARSARSREQRRCVAGATSRTAPQHFQTSDPQRATLMSETLLPESRAPADFA
jgi:hypothetical protein